MAGRSYACLERSLIADSPEPVDPVTERAAFLASEDGFGGVGVKSGGEKRGQRFSNLEGEDLLTSGSRYEIQYLSKRDSG